MIKIIKSKKTEQSSPRAGFLPFIISGFLLGLSVVVPAVTAPPAGNSAFVSALFSALEWVAMIPAARVLLTPNRYRHAVRGAYLRGFLFFLCYYLVMYYWFIYLYPLDFAGMTPMSAVAVIAAAWFGLSALQAAAFAPVFVLIVIAARKFLYTGAVDHTKTDGKNNNLRGKYSGILPFLAGALWVVFEWAQTQTWAGVPWGRLAIGQHANSAVIQSMSLFGSYIITFMVVLTNFAIAASINNGTYKQPCAAICAALLTANLIFGVVSLGLYSDEGLPVRAAALQCNIASADKWDDETGLDKTIEACKKLSLLAAASGAEIIVMPETVIPYTMLHYPSITKKITEIAELSGADLLVGTYTSNMQGQEVDKIGRGGEGLTYNSAVRVTPGGVDENVYSKRHLVPFGEYLPMRRLVSLLIPPLAELNILGGDVTPGLSSAVFDFDRVRAGAFICFDSIYEELARKSILDGAELFVIMTNDSWFLDSAAVYMHNAQAVLRAVEFGRYVIRSANTGISSVITPTGEIVACLGPLVEGYITADIHARSDLTLYARTGNLLVLICALFSFGVLVFAWRTRG